MWLAMMAIMMAPTVWPWVRTFRRMSAPEARGARAIRTTTSFLAGYVMAWVPYSVGAALLQATFTITGIVAAMLLIGAGLFQFAPLKRACLRHCRNPVSYLLARWHNTPRSGFRIGLEHGLFCVGCCWALMATALAVGMMNLWWILALAGVAFTEQVSTRGEQVRRATGLALALAGLYQLI